MSPMSATTSPEAPLVVFGTTVSYYTGKLEAYLRAKGIGYRLEPFSQSNIRRAASHTGVVQVLRRSPGLVHFCS
jgi:hypothetical protein